MAINHSEPLSDFLSRYRESGIDVAAFKTHAGDRYALRIVDPEDPETGLAFLASFAKGVKEADRPSDENQQILANRKLNDILNDPKKQTRFVVCTCVVDEQSLKDYDYAEEDLGKTWLTVANSGTSTSDAYREYVEVKKEKSSGKTRGRA